MQTSTELAKLPEEALWHLAEKRLALVYLDHEQKAAASTRPRAAEETLADWLDHGLQQARKKRQATTGKVVAFPAKPLRPPLFTPLAEMIRLAADSGDQLYPLPDPDVALESNNGRFRLQLQAVANNKIEVTLQCLGFAAEEFAAQRLGLVSADNQDKLIADIRLDEDGDGSVLLANTEANRRALLHPIIVLVVADGD